MGAEGAGTMRPNTHYSRVVYIDFPASDITTLRAIEEAHELAVEEDVVVRFNLNGWDCEVTRWHKPKEVDAAFKKWLKAEL